MDVIGGLLQGFSVALQPANLFWCFVGCFLGTVVGILPGLGPAATIAMLLPLTYKMDPAGGIIMMAGIYYGAKYGGSTTSILLNIPGESSSVVTCIDGHQMARNGRAGAALGIAAIASFIAGTFGVIALSLIAPPVAAFALSFSSPEYFALMCLGLALVVLLSGPSLIKGLLAMLIGLWLTSIGTDLFTAQSRFIFGQSVLLGGIDVMVIAIGVFAIAEVLSSIEAGDDAQLLPVPRGIRNLLPNLEELKACRFAFLNGSVVGFLLGCLPGAGATIASFISYGVEKAVSKHPEKFGHGAPEGVAAPEGANNADTGGAAGAAAHARHSRRQLDRDHALGAGAVGREARPADDAGIARRVLGPGLQHVYRQRHAAGPEPAAGAVVCADPPASRLHSVSDASSAFRWSAPLAHRDACSISAWSSLSGCSAT